MTTPRGTKLLRISVPDPDAPGGQEALDFIEAAPSDYGKPRPAVEVQSDRLAETDRGLRYLLISVLAYTFFHRVAVDTGSATGLRQASQVMVDKIVTMKRARL